MKFGHTMKKTFCAFYLSILFLLVSTSYAGETSFEHAPKTTKQGIITFWPSWIQDKGDKYDVGMNIQNDSETKDIIVLINDLKCSRGDLSGRIKHTFFNTGERTIDLTPGEHKKFNLVCYLSEETEGEYVLEIKRVYANPSNDGATRGNILASNLRWTGNAPPKKSKK